MDILLSIKPKYTKFIKSGEKLVELRRYVNINIKRVLVYESLPSKMIIGYFICDSVKYLPLSILWEETKFISCLSREDFYSYFYGKDRGYGIFFRKFYLGQPTKLDTFFKHSPQNYYCLTPEKSFEMLKSLNLKV